MLMQPEVIERHFHDLIQRYGSVVVVDLLNQVIVKYSFLIVDVKYMLGWRFLMNENVFWIL